MKSQIYYKLIFIPIILMIIVITLITLYNINTWKKHENETITELTIDYTERNRDKIKNTVEQFINDIKYSRKEHEKQIKIDIKHKVDKLTASLESDYSYNKYRNSKEELKQELLNIIRSQNKHGDDNYFFVLDIDSSIALVHNIPFMQGKELKNKKDLKGTLTFESKVDLLKNRDSNYQTLYFEKPSQVDIQSEKLVYFKKFKYFNWIIGTGVYLKDEEKKLQNKIINKFNTIQTDLTKYIFVSQLHNEDGGKNFATVKVMPNKRSLIGKKISEDSNNTEVTAYRKRYLQMLKEDGNGFISYLYEKPNSNVKSEKESYMYLYKPWNWIVGSGFYFDDLEKKILKKEVIIEEEVISKTYQIIGIGLFLILISSIIFYTFTKNIISIIDQYVEKLDKQKNTFKALFENTTDGIMLIKNGFFYNCNTAVLGMFGFSSKEESVIGKSACDLSPELQADGLSSHEHAIKYIDSCLAGNDVNFQWKHKKENGEIFDVEVTFTKIILNGEEIIHAVLRDVSQKNALLKESKQKDNILIQQSKMASMGEMIGNIAHQWRQPLNALGLTIQKIKMYHDEDILTTKELDKSVEKSKMLINKMSATIDDFRNFFKVNKVKQNFCINEAIMNTSLLLESSLVHHNIKLNIKSDNEINHLGYQNELEQVLLNIINNSKDALIEKSTQNPTIAIKLLSNDNVIDIVVSDNAGGIPSSIIEKIFEPYFTTKEQGKGTGIGLYMSKMIIETNMNGILKVKNIKDGACFTIQLKKEIKSE